MPFNSLQFLFIFLPFVLIATALIEHSRYRQYKKLMLTLFSVVFIALNSVAALLPLAGSLFFNGVLFFFLGKYKNPWLLAFGILLNLLQVFSYKLAGVKTDNLLIPIGLSYYAFQQIGFLINRYETEIRAGKTGLQDYVFNIVFFPKFLSGPVLTEPVPETASDRGLQSSDVIAGLFVFSIGLAKKAIIADTILAPLIRGGYSRFALTDSVSAWAGVLMFLFHLYFDFSGYSDMAYGLARMLNFKLPWNFKAPFKSASLIEFWKNWHASLSAFVNFYFFNFIIRLRPSRFSYQMFCILLSMVVIGLWHNLELKYLAFGALNGLALIVNYCFRRYAGVKLPRRLSVVFTFLTFAVCFAFFCSPDFYFALKVLKSAFSFTSPGGFRSEDGLQLLYAAGLFVFCQVCPSTEDWEKSFKLNTFFLLFCLLNLFVAILCLPRPEPFIYEGF